MPALNMPHDPATMNKLQNRGTVVCCPFIWRLQLKQQLQIYISFFIRPSKEGTYYGMALSVLLSVCRAVCLSVRSKLLVNAISSKPLVILTSYFDMALISVRPRTLMIWGILQKPRWPPQQSKDLHCTLYRILLVNAVS